MAIEFNLHKIFLNTAKEFSTLSHCVFEHNGAVLVKNGMIIAHGINGTPSNIFNCDEIFDSTSYDYEKHDIFANNWEISAEMNCILYCSRVGISTEGSELFCTSIPHKEDIKFFMTSGIKKIYYISDCDVSLEEKTNIYKACSTLNINIEQIGI